MPQLVVGQMGRIQFLARLLLREGVQERRGQETMEVQVAVVGEVIIQVALGILHRPHHPKGTMAVLEYLFQDKTPLVAGVEHLL